MRNRPTRTLSIKAPGYRDYTQGMAKEVVKTTYLPVGQGNTIRVEANGDIVYATCLKILAKYIAQTKWNLYGTDNKEVSNIMEQFYRVLNVHTYHGINAYDFWHYMELQRNAYGNAFAYIHYDSKANLDCLAPLNASYMNVLWDDANILDGKRKIVYQYQEQRNGKTYTMMPEEVLHLKANSVNGIIGRSALSVLTGTMQSNADAESALRTSIGNGYTGTILLTYTSDLSKTRQEQLLNAVMDNLQKSNGKILPLPVGMDAKNINNDVKSMYEVLKKYNAQAISSFFGIPTAMLNIEGGTGMATFSTNQLTQFYNGTIAPIVAQYANELTCKLLTDRQIGKGIRFDSAGDSFDFLDAQAKASVLATYVNAMILTPNECRASLKYPASDDVNADRLVDRSGNAGGTLGDHAENEGGNSSDN